MKDPWVGAVFTGWTERAVVQAHTRKLEARHAVSPEGSALMLRNIQVDTFAHMHECHAMLSEKIGLVVMYVVRWYGTKTMSPRHDRTMWYASLEDALDAVRDRYNTDEVVWRLGG